MKTPFLGIVAEDFEGIDEGELTLTAGTQCVVVLCEDDGWWTIHTKDSIGIFPGSYVDEVDEITLPCYAKVQKTIPQGNIPVGKIVTVKDITANGWNIEHNGTSATCKWDCLEITTEEPEKEPTPKDRKKLFATSVIDCEPIKIEDDIEPIKEIKMPEKRATVQMDTIKTSGPSKAGPSIAKEKRVSTYKRPVSIFGEFKLNSTFDIVFDNDKAKLYSMPDPNRPKYEQEGRWEFRATEDVPPPPPFQNLPKKYETEKDPSYIDFQAKERSAVFDI